MLHGETDSDFRDPFTKLVGEQNWEDPISLSHFEAIWREEFYQLLTESEHPQCTTCQTFDDLIKSTSSKLTRQSHITDRARHLANAKAMKELNVLEQLSSEKERKLQETFGTSWNDIKTELEHVSHQPFQFFPSHSVTVRVPPIVPNSNYSATILSSHNASVLLLFLIL
jgi:hypothetical protein